MLLYIFSCCFYFLLNSLFSFFFTLDIRFFMTLEIYFFIFLTVFTTVFRTTLAACLIFLNAPFTIFFTGRKALVAVFLNLYLNFFLSPFDVSAQAGYAAFFVYIHPTFLSILSLFKYAENTLFIVALSLLIIPKYSSNPRPPMEAVAKKLFKNNCSFAVTPGPACIFNTSSKSFSFSQIDFPGCNNL
mgnify:CR=1 FL=1